MNYTHKGNKNLLIWDGSDEGITDNTYKIACPQCQQEVAYHVRDMQSINSVEQELREYLIDKKIVSQSERGFELKRELPAYAVEVGCNSCSSLLTIIIGVKEVQPQRYTIYFKSIVVGRKVN